jgi:hypothetical protein
MRRRIHRSVTTFRSAAATVANASPMLRSNAATASPVPVPTTRLPICMGNHAIGKIQPGSRLMHSNARASRDEIAGRRAAAIDATKRDAPTTATPIQRTLMLAPFSPFLVSPAAGRATGPLSSRTAEPPFRQAPMTLAFIAANSVSSITPRERRSASFASSSLALVDDAVTFWM